MNICVNPVICVDEDGQVSSGNISQTNLSGHCLLREIEECPEHLPLPLSPLHTLQGKMELASYSVFDKHCSSSSPAVSHCPGSLAFQGP